MSENAEKIPLPISSASRTDASFDRVDQAYRRQYLSLDDFERVSKRRLPRMIHGFIANGSETEATVRWNREAFDQIALKPRVLTAATRRVQARSIFGKQFDAPFGISPMGAAAACAYRADVALATAAKAHNIPMVLSASSLIAMEEVRQHNDNLWYQAYLPGDEKRIQPLLERVQAAGFEVLIITADGPLGANRENNARNGFSIPVRPSMKATIDCIRRPKWLGSVLIRTCMRHGLPRFENLDAARRPPLLSRKLEHEMSGRDSLSWRHIEQIRKWWSGKLAVKGILAGDDAKIARDLGADGVIVSNHGGRQLDSAMATMRALPEVADAAGEMSVLLDGGVRRGTDVIKAIASGADFVLLGRPFLYAASVAGEAGVRRAGAILKEEINRDLGLMGLDDIALIDANSIVMR